MIRLKLPNERTSQFIFAYACIPNQQIYHETVLASLNFNWFLIVDLSFQVFFSIFFVNSHGHGLNISDKEINIQSGCCRRKR